MSNNRFKLGTRRRGFTLVELLVVVLILSILMAVALPLYLSAVTDAQKKTCRANMQTIANAAQAWRVRTAAANYGTIASASPGTAINIANLSDLSGVPTCPSAGSYTIIFGNSGANDTFAVKCSLAAHATYQPGVDSN